MESILVSNKAIKFNLKRTASMGLVSLLSIKKINDLSLKYFGVYENGNLVGYQCPYSGQILTTTNDIVLEHIIPISSGGGTTLFNCIPTSIEVNKFSEKGTEHLITWWINSKYWDAEAPKRLEKLLQYMLEAYDISFNQNTRESIFFDDIVDENNHDSNLENQAGNLSITQEEHQVKNNSLITYYDFISELIDELGKFINVEEYRNKLNILINQNIFNNIERLALIQKSLKEIIKNKLNLKDRSELTLMLNINISKIASSLEDISNSEIYSILETRVNNIDLLLSDNNLSLNSFFTDKNSLKYLYKPSAELTVDDKNQLIKNINMCVKDKFYAMIKFVSENNGTLPNQHSDIKQESILGRFRNNIQQIEKSKNKFYVSLPKEQLEYLHNSEYESLREIYIIILNRAIDNNIEISYIDEKMKDRILKFKEKSKYISLEDKIKLESEYSDVIINRNQFNQFINYVIINSGNLPSTESKYDYEKKLGRFRSNIMQIQKNIGKFVITLSKEQLEYLHNSEYESLREIYIIILNKAIKNNIGISYVDEKMKARILEFKEKSKDISLEDKIKLEIEYSDVIVDDSQFNQFINYVIINSGNLPSTKSNDEKEKKLGSFRNGIQSIKKGSHKFVTMLSKEQLEYLYNSEYESLREIYKIILNKAIDNNIEISYVDEKMKTRILEFKEKAKDILLEDKIKLENEYSDVIVIESKFNKFIEYVIKNNGVLPKQTSIDKEENQLGSFRNSIQAIRKKSSVFYITLSKEQLEYLYNSEYESLREIYFNIMEKAIDINYQPYIEIDNKLRNKSKGKVA